MKIGILGNGVVGYATGRAFLEWAEVRAYDTTPERSTHTLKEVLDCDFIFCCLPSPQQMSGSGFGTDLFYIHQFFEQVEGSEANFVLRSTVPIGTTAKLRDKYKLPNLVHSPEFLTARTSIVDAQIPARNIIGGPVCNCRSKLSQLYRSRFRGVPLMLMTSDESEAVKLFTNTLFSVKISILNELRTLADHHKISWEKVMEGILSDGRISQAHVRTPGPDGRYGFGGSCLPKDLASVIHLLREAGLGDNVAYAAYKRNIEDRKRGS